MLSLGLVFYLLKITKKSPHLRAKRIQIIINSKNYKLNSKRKNAVNQVYKKLSKNL